jgi:hypothetical protein
MMPNQALRILSITFKSSSCLSKAAVKARFKPRNRKAFLEINTRKKGQQYLSILTWEKWGWRGQIFI